MSRASTSAMGRALLVAIVAFACLAGAAHAISFKDIKGLVPGAFESLTKKPEPEVFEYEKKKRAKVGIKKLRPHEGEDIEEVIARYEHAFVFSTNDNNYFTPRENFKAACRELVRDKGYKEVDFQCFYLNCFYNELQEGDPSKNKDRSIAGSKPDWKRLYKRPMELLGFKKFAEVGFPTVKYIKFGNFEDVVDFFPGREIENFSDQEDRAKFVDQFKRVLNNDHIRVVEDGKEWEEVAIFNKKDNEKWKDVKKDRKKDLRKTFLDLQVEPMLWHAVAYFDNDTDASIVSEFTKFGNKNWRTMVSLQTDSASFLTTIEKTLKLSAPAIIFKHPIEETVRVFDADITAANLQGYFDNIGTPMVLGEGWVPHVQSIYDSFKDQRSQFVYTIFSAKKIKYETIQQTIEFVRGNTLAKAKGDKMEWCNRSSKKLRQANSLGKCENKYYMEDEKYTEGDMDRDVVFAAYSLRETDGLKNPKAYVMDGEVTAENVNQFIKDLYAGKLTNRFAPPRAEKSEPVPEDNSDVVKTIVGNNIRQYIPQTTDKNLLIYCYANFCKECKEFIEDTLPSIAEDYEGKEVIVGTFNGPLNKIPVDIEPTIAAQHYKEEELDLHKAYPSVVFLGTNGSVRRYKGKERTDQAYRAFLDEKLAEVAKSPKVQKHSDEKPKATPKEEEAKAEL